MATIKVLGCLPCLLMGLPDRHAEVHHMLDGSGEKRLGHAFTIGLCAWHHRGILNPGYSSADMVDVYGVSYGKGSKVFVEAFGTELQLLEVQNFMLRAFESMPWADYSTPLYMVAQVMESWVMERKS